jgi:hypothetical protein
MSMQVKVLVGVVAAAIIGAAAYTAFFRHAAAPAPESAPVAEEKTLPPEPLFTLPEGARKIDDYAFSLDGRVYFRSVTSTSTLPIPGADPETFERLHDFMTYPGEAIVNDCGASGTYTYYEDKNRVYLYQIWRAPKFRSSKVEVLADVTPDAFSIEDATHARAASQRVAVEYRVATSTCSYVLAKT